MTTVACGRSPPVIHVDSDVPLQSDVDGSLITDQMWGIYYKPDFNFDGIQGGAAPYLVDRPAEQVDKWQIAPRGENICEQEAGKVQHSRPPGWPRLRTLESLLPGPCIVEGHASRARNLPCFLVPTIGQ